MITKAQIKLIHTLLHLYETLRGFKIDPSEKIEFVKECSGGRVTSTTQLTWQEAKKMIEVLQNLTCVTDEYQKADRMRKLIIHYARQMGWENEAEGKRRADMDRIEGWCIKFGYLHKKLNEYTTQELPRLVTQFQNVYKSFLKAI